jgi:hypothetical protein
MSATAAWPRKLSRFVDPVKKGIDRGSAKPDDLVYPSGQTFGGARSKPSAPTATNSATESNQPNAGTTGQRSNQKRLEVEVARVGLPRFATRPRKTMRGRQVGAWLRPPGAATLRPCAEDSAQEAELQVVRVASRGAPARAGVLGRRQIRARVPRLIPLECRADRTLTRRANASGLRFGSMAIVSTQNDIPVHWECRSNRRRRETAGAPPYNLAHGCLLAL